MGLAGTTNLPTEEVIHILVNSYNCSERNQEVQSEVALLSEKVTLDASTLTLLIHAQIANSKH